MMLFLPRATGLFFFSLVLTITGSAKYQLVVQAGHEGVPTALRWHQASQTILSTGEDGRLIIRDPHRRQILHRFRVSSSPIMDLENAPLTPRVAVLNENQGSYRISVWNWADEKLLYSVDLNTEPLFMSWSAGERYLVVGQLDSPHILVLNGRNGRRVSYLQGLPSLYNTGYIGSTESIMMTYSSTGMINYWDIRSSALKFSVETIENLEHFSVLQSGDKSTVFAFRDETLYLLNRQTGALLDQVIIPNLREVSLDPHSEEIDILSLTQDEIFLHEYEIKNKHFHLRQSADNFFLDSKHPRLIDKKSKPMGILRRNKKSYLISTEGLLHIIEATGSSVFIKDYSWQPEALSFYDDFLYLSGNSKIVRFRSPFFKEDASGDWKLFNNLRRQEIPLETKDKKVPMLNLSDGSLLFGTRFNTKNTGGYSLVDFDAPERNRDFAMTGSLIQKIKKLEEDYFLITDRSGKISLIQPDLREPIMSYSSLGILDATFASDRQHLLTARSSVGQRRSPLEQVDIQTRESLSIPDDRFMVYLLDNNASGLYSIGIKKDQQGVSSTVLMQHEEQPPYQSQIILKKEGEHSKAVLLADGQKKGLYLSWGNTVQHIAKKSLTLFPSDEKIITMALRANILYGIDADGTLILWNTKTAKQILRVYFFDTGNWVAIPPSRNRLWKSPGKIEGAVLYQSGKRLTFPPRD